MRELIDSLFTMIPGTNASTPGLTWFLFPNWLWVVVAIGTATSLALHPLILLAFRRAKRILQRQKDQADYGERFIDQALERPIESALSWILLSLVWLAVFDTLGIKEGPERYLLLISKLILAVNLIRLGYNLMDALGSSLTAASRRASGELNDQIFPFAVRIGKVLVVILGVLTTLQNLGVNVVSLLAGLGLGGLALALAAQDTVANFFGSIMILVDRPFKVGDWIKVGTTEGTVEEIGFRSTRIRTFYNSLITVPNSVVAKEQIDNMGQRPRRRIRQTLGILYETPPEKIKEFTDRVRYVILQEDKVDRSDVRVFFNNFNAASLDILMQFHLVGVQTAQEELSRTQDIFMEIINVAQEVGVEFAYPTQTLYLKKGDVPPAS